MPGADRRPARTLVGIDGAAYIAIAVSFGLAAGIIGRAKGSSFLIWFVVGAVFLLFGLIAVILFRSEHTEPEQVDVIEHLLLAAHARVGSREPVVEDQRHPL